MKNNFKRFAMNSAIVLLFLSALFLTVLCWFGNGSGGIKGSFAAIKDYAANNFSVSPNEEIYEYTEYAYSLDALAPLRGAVRTEAGLACVTNRSGAKQLFERMGNILTYAFDTAVMDRELSVREWENYLKGEMVLFDFEGCVPLYSLAAYLGTGRFDTLYLEPRYMMFVPQDEGLLLCVKTGDGHTYAFTTAVKTDLAGLEEIYPPDGSELGIESIFSQKLPAETMLTEARGSAYVLSESAGINDFASAGGERMINSVLEALDFNTYSTGSYIESDSTHVYVENLNTLRVHPDGSMNYNAGTPENGTGELTYEDRAAAVSSALEIAQKILSEELGAAELYICRTYENNGNFIVLLGCEYDGLRIECENGYAARFVFRGLKLMEAQIKLTRYEVTEEAELLIPDIQAAALAVEKGKVSGFELRYGNVGEKWYCGWFYN